MQNGKNFGQMLHDFHCDTKLHIYVERICTHVKRELYSFKCEESERLSDAFVGKCYFAEKHLQPSYS
jgi:hypothetical protein